jgi:hypothetical protein
VPGLGSGVTGLSKEVGLPVVSSVTACELGLPENYPDRPAQTRRTDTRAF